MADDLAGWTAPVYQAITNPPLIGGGVPPVYLVCVYLGTVAGCFLTWRSLLLGPVAYLGGVSLTAWEANWWGLLRAYFSYKVYYEG